MPGFMPGDGLFEAITHFARYLLPALALWILWRCVRSMLRERYEPEVWAHLEFPNRARAAVEHWETILGRSKSCDVVIGRTDVARSHAALIRDSRGRWKVYPLDGDVYVNDEEADRHGLWIGDGDTLWLGSAQMLFTCLSDADLVSLSKNRTAPGWAVRPGFTLLVLTVFQLLLAFCHVCAAAVEHAGSIALAFAALVIVQWLYYFIMRAMRRSGFEVETIAFFLSSLGLSVAATSVPGDMLKQTLLMLAGVALFLILGWWLRDLKRVRLMRLPVAALAIAFLAVNIILSEEVFGAKNWLEIGGFSLQPSEFVKIAFVYVGATALDKLFRSNNILFFIVFAAICVGALALMGDFGTALIFFVTFLVIAFMRSGNLATVFLAIGSAVLAGMLMLTIKPHIASRFATWGHIWEVPNDGGYQQTRALSAAASGGLFGQGAGKGWLEHVFAADTDLVFCVLCEELGLILAITAVVALLVLAAFTVKNAAAGRSSYYVIGACAAVSLLLVQTALNIFGAVDILPFTGVTFPFVSRGGSSLISCWALLAFIKAADTRVNASFVVKLPSGVYRGGEDGEEDGE